MKRTFVPSCAALLMILGFGASAFAEGADVAAAESLFRDGKKLLDDRNYVEACPKLAESYRLDQRRARCLRSPCAMMARAKLPALGPSTATSYDELPKRAAPIASRARANTLPRRRPTFHAYCFGEQRDSRNDWA